MRRLTKGLAVVSLALAATAPAARADVSPQYFPLPADHSKMTGGMAVSNDGTVFFGGGDGFEATPPIGRLVETQAVPGTSNGMSFVPTPDAPGCCSSQFRDMAWSTFDNTLYWTRSDGLAGRLDGDRVTTVAVPGDPWGIAAAPLGGAWLAENYSSNVGPSYIGDRIAYVSPSVGLTESVSLAMQSGPWDGSRYDAKPMGIAVASDGTPWFTEADAGNPGYRIAKGVGTGYTEWRPCPTAALCSGVLSGSALTDIAIAPDGGVWYTNEVKKTIGRLESSGGAYQEFPLSQMAVELASGRPLQLTTSPDGSIWMAVYGGYSSPAANAVVRITPSVPPTATVYKLGTDLAPTALATDANGNVWFAGTSSTGAQRLGRLAFGAPLGPGGAQPTPTPDPTVVVTPPATNSTPTTLTATSSGTAKVTDPTVRGDAVNANQICVGPPQDRCSLVYLIQTHEYVTGFPNTHGLLFGKPKKKVLTTVGTLKVTLKGGEKQKVTIKLNAKGKKLRKKMSFKAILTVTQSINGKKPKTVLKKNLKFKK